jgi:hypothetical protein
MPELPEPTFCVNDRVVVTGSGVHQGAIGAVTEVYLLSGMHRYVIEFEDRTTAVFFGFELEACSRS